MPEPVCVRCGGPVGLTVDNPSWHCPTHGEVEPLHAPLPAEHYHLTDVASSWGSGVLDMRRRLRP